MPARAILIWAGLEQYAISFFRLALKCKFSCLLAMAGLKIPQLPGMERSRVDGVLFASSMVVKSRF